MSGSTGVEGAAGVAGADGMAIEVPDPQRYRAGPYDWLDELDELAVHTGVPRQRMGTRRIDGDRWLLVDRHHGAETDLRRRLLEQARPAVYRTEPAAHQASVETALLVADWLGRYGPGSGSGDSGAGQGPETGTGDSGHGPSDGEHGPSDSGHTSGPGADPSDPGHTPGPDPGDASGKAPDGSATRHGLDPVLLGDDPEPLVTAAAAIQEDLCLMQRFDDGWRLTAAVVCFPTHWRLDDKFGRTQEAIHGPVPHYAVDLADKVTRFFDRLGPNRIVARRNWGFSPDARLHTPTRRVLGPEEGPAPADAWLRSERQTLRRLLVSDAVLFTIRVQLAPVSVLADRPDLCRRLAAALGDYSPELVGQQATAQRWMLDVETWLNDIAAGSTPAASR